MAITRSSGVLRFSLVEFHIYFVARKIFCYELQAIACNSGSPIKLIRGVKLGQILDPSQAQSVLFLAGFYYT